MDVCLFVKSHLGVVFGLLFAQFVATAIAVFFFFAVHRVR